MTEPGTTDDDSRFVLAEGPATNRNDRTRRSAKRLLDLLQQATGKKPMVTLRDPGDGNLTPMLKPLGRDEIRRVGKYTIHGEIGRDGTGIVHRAHDRELGREVAITLMPARSLEDAKTLARWVEQVQIGSQLQHAGIGPIYDFGVAGGTPFVTKALTRGHTLASLLAQRESPTGMRRELLAIFERVCDAIAYAHRRGVAHLGLTPDGIVVGAFGEVRITDWSAARVLARGGIADEERAAAHHSRIGNLAPPASTADATTAPLPSGRTLAYMPPEQARGDQVQIREQSDVFALGAILCEILTGDPVYVGRSSDLHAFASNARQADAIDRLERCTADRQLIDLTIRCIQPDPAERPMSAVALSTSLATRLDKLEDRIKATEASLVATHAVTKTSRRRERIAYLLLVIVSVAWIARSCAS